MPTPRVSVIVPVHNSERCLPECLDSILTQTENNIEVICINDGSTDSSASILKDYVERDGRLTVISKECLGAGAARNKGLSVAKGTYLSFLDSDDFFEPNMLKDAANRMDQPEADVVIFGSWIYDERRKADRQATWNLRRRFVPDTQPFTFRELADHAFLAFGNCVWNRLFRRGFVESYHLRFQEISRANDLLFSCSSIVLAKHLCTLEQSYVHYRVGTGTSLQSTNDREPLSFYKAFSALRSFISERGLSEELEVAYANHVLDGITYNADSLHSLEGLKRLKNAIKNEFEPELNLLLLPADCFEDMDRLEQYRSLCTDEINEYLFRRLSTIRADRDNCSWQIDWNERRLRKSDQELANAANHIKNLQQELDNARKQTETVWAELYSIRKRAKAAQAELDTIRTSHSFRIGVALTAPVRLIKQGLSRMGR